MESKLLVVGLLLIIVADFSATQSQEPVTLRVGWTFEPDHMNPFVGTFLSYFEIQRLTYNYLVEFGKDLEPVPGLAESWESSPDGLSWTYHLVKNARWHDGQPFTSADVKFTFDYVIKNNLSLYINLLKNVVSVETPDDYTVIVRTNAGVPYMDSMMLPIIPEHIWNDITAEEAITYANEPCIGTGPFKFVEWKRGEYIKLVANDEYFKGRPKIDEVVFVLFGNNEAMVQALKLGEVDVISNIPATMVAGLKDEPNVKVITPPQQGYFNISINIWDSSLTKNNPDLPNIAGMESRGNPLLLDKRIRVAMAHAVDRQRILDMVYLGNGQAEETIVPQPSWHFEIPEGKKYKFDLEKARSILENAGYIDRNGDGIRESTKGEKLEFRFYIGSSFQESVKVGQLLEGWFKDIGIKLDTEVMDDAALFGKVYDSGNQDLILTGWVLPPDPNFGLSVLTCEQIMGWSDCNYCNKTYDDLFARQATTVDKEKRKEIVAEMQRLAYEDAPYIVYYYPVAIQAFRTDKFEGWVEDQINGAVMAYSNATFTQLHLIGEEEKKTGISPLSLFTGLTIVLLLRAYGRKGS